jgi:hypothetical protein
LGLDPIGMFKRILIYLNPKLLNVLFCIDFPSCMNQLWDIEDWIEEFVVSNSLLSEQSVLFWKLDQSGTR